MAKRVAKRLVRWTKKDDAEMRKHSRAKTRVKKVAKQLKRTENAVRQRASILGIPLGHQT